MNSQTYLVEEKEVLPITVAGIRMKGRYGDCGKAFGRIWRSLGRFAKGPAMMLHYDCCYKADDADFEACVPVRQTRVVAGIDVHELPGGKCVSLMHRGPYDQLGSSYERITRYVQDHGYKTSVPSRELYLKGPGMIFKGNPRRYLTEIQMMIEPAS